MTLYEEIERIALLLHNQSVNSAWADLDETEKDHWRFNALFQFLFGPTSAKWSQERLGYEISVDE